MVPQVGRPSALQGKGREERRDLPPRVAQRRTSCERPPRSMSSGAPHPEPPAPAPATAWMKRYPTTSASR